MKRFGFGLCTIRLSCIFVIYLFLGNIGAYADTLRVTDYGAVPNDGGDDRAAIQSTIQGASPGDTVFFPAGTYRVSGAISGKSGVNLQGSGAPVLLYTGNFLDCIISLVSVSNMKVSGLVLDGNHSDRVTAGVLAAYGSGIVLDSLTLRDLGNAETWGPHGIMFSSSVTDSEITNNTITNIATATEWGAGIRLAHGSSRHLVEGNTITNTGRGGILCNNDSTDIVIRNNIISGSGGEGLGIELWVGCDRGIVEDNIVDHWISIAVSDYCAVRRNVISEKSGIYKLAGIEAIAENYIYTDNLVDDGALLGISISGALPKDYALWTGNTIRACATWGAQLQGESTGCGYHYFYRNKFLESNRDQPPAWYPDQGHGFRFNGNTHHITFEENEFSNNEGDGIQVTGGNVNFISFVNNTIVDNAYASVWDYFGSDVEWEGNTVSGNTWNHHIVSRGFAGNVKPVASFICPSLAKVGQSVEFINASYDPDGSLGHVLWDLGDGIPGSELHPTHIYEAPGSYVVTLVVWDDLGRAKLATKTICVRSVDLHADGTIDMLDMAQLVRQWLWIESVETPSNFADLNCDGKVDLTDIADLCSAWLQ